MSTTVIILAAGKGTRMRSKLPKVLQPLAGRPLLGHVIQTAKKLHAQNIITIYGHGGDLVKQSFAAEQIEWVEQAEQLGTGHAVQMTLPVLPQDGISLILYGDVPLVRQSTLEQLLDASSQSGIGMITLNVENPTGYGRIVRQADKIQAIVEHKDIVAMAVADGLEIASIQPELEFEVEGVNDRLQLATLERQFQQQQAKELMQQGVHLIDPNRFDLRGTVKCGQDVQIDVNVIIEGDCELGDNVQLGAGCILKNTRIAAGTKVQAYSIFENAIVGENTQIGPFARLRPGANLANDVHIGNFVEVKNSNIGLGSKANHFTYLGDADIGADCNIGAGTITCNYDGANKHRTVIEDNVFIGTNNSLVAPIKIAQGATTGAGSTLTRDVAEHSLAVERSKQFEKANYQRPQKLKK